MTNLLKRAVNSDVFAGIPYTDAEATCRFYGLKPPAPVASAAE